MAAKNPTYDLVLMLDTGAPDEQRAKVLADVERIIGAGGEVIGKQDWGARATAYEIRHKADAEYHLVQFHGTPEVLSTLDRTLRITDGVIRHRIIKLAPGTPEPPAERPEPRPAAAGAPVEQAAAPAEAAPPAVEAPEQDAETPAETAADAEAPAPTA
jgi:small subunit ribosomal protein S6